MIATETWIDLLKDWNHWLFELISGSIQAGVIALIFRPVFRQALRLHDERKHKHVHCEDVHPKDDLNGQ